MKVIHLSYSDGYGGAAIAAHRLHSALCKAGVDSSMWVNHPCLGDRTVRGPRNRLALLYARHCANLVAPLKKIHASQNNSLLSPAVLPSNWAKQINASDADIVHLHWISQEMMSIADIGRITKPIVWTLHDMWGFCGAEHYTEDSRWRDGYNPENRAHTDSGFDLCKWVWQRKRKHWRLPMHIVSPSNWLAGCARASALMKTWPVHRVPNCIDTARWKPIDRKLARDIWSLPQDVPLALFGAIGGGADSRKGFDLLRQATAKLVTMVPNLEICVFGERQPKVNPFPGLSVHYLGHLQDEISLITLYSAADVFVLPSRQDNLPNTGIEAMACGTPVVGFNVGGLPDIVQHLQTGYLAQAFDPSELADGVAEVLEKQPTGEYRKRARDYAVNEFATDGVVEAYLEVYNQALNT